MIFLADTYEIARSNIPKG